MIKIKSAFNVFKFLFALAVLVFFNPFSSVAQTQLKAFYITGYAQGTTYHITYYAKDSVVLKADIDRVLDGIDSSLSVYKSYSLISKFNNRDCREVNMDKHLAIVAKKSLEIYQQSKGLFDITVYPLVRAWGFGNKEINSLPDSAYINAIMPCVGSDKLLVNRNKLIKKSACVQIDVDGIAQGYSVDVLANFLDKRSIKNYLVEVGGEIRVKGKKHPENVPMQIGIEGPASNALDDPIIQKIIQIDHGAVTTSGNYRKYFKSGNQVMSHLIDPKTGYPLQNEMIAVTVWAKDALTADGYDNPLMAMGVQKAMLFLKKHKNMEAYFIYHKLDGSVADTASRGFYKLIKK